MVTPALMRFLLTVPMNAQLGTDLPEAPTLGVQAGCTLNIHGATVTGSHRHHLAALANFAFSRPRNQTVQIHRLRQSGQDLRFDHQQLPLRRGRRRRGAIGDGDHELAAWYHKDQLAVQSYGAVGRR